MSQCTDPGEARACFASAESGERDAEAGPECLDVPRIRLPGEQGWRVARACFAGRGL